MSRMLCTLALVALTLSGCEDSPSHITSTSAIQDKPVVTVVPVIDSTKDTRAWNLSDELTAALYSQLSHQDRVYLVDFAQAQSKRRMLQESQNPFGSDVAWIKKAFHGDEFIVFLELIEHEEIARRNTGFSNTAAADLEMSMRVRAFDVRAQTPKVILQEIVHRSYFIPHQYTASSQFHQISWQEDNYSLSPLGIAHADFVKEIASRLQDYIRLNN
jgi:hypothetical protein